MENTITFTQQVKEEIASNIYESKDRLRALLAAFIKINGTLTFKNKKSVLLMSTENAKIAKFIYSNLKEIYQADTTFEYLQKKSLNKKMVYKISVNTMSDEIIDDLEISFLEGKISKNMVRNDDTIAGYLAGAFLASGSINSPKSSNYHLEISLDSENYAKWMIHLFKRYKNIDIVPKIAPRRNKFILYFKKSDRIAEFLALIGAIHSCMDFESIRVDRDFINSANRLSNFDTANMKKSYETALRQKDEILFIENKLGIKNITNKKMRILCGLRLSYESASMKELATMLSSELDEPVSKSNINHLFRSIHDLYERLKK